MNSKNMSTSEQLNSNESSSSENGNPSVNNRKVPHKKGLNRPYECIMEFSDCPSAIRRLKQPICNTMYKFRYTRHTITGQKDFYHCQGHQKCPKTLYILRHSDSLKSSIWLCSMSHAHMETRGSSLPQNSVAHIKKLFKVKSRYTNSEILNSLRRHNCPPLTIGQINNLKSRLKLRNGRAQEEITIDDDGE